MPAVSIYPPRIPFFRISGRTESGDESGEIFSNGQHGDNLLSPDVGKDQPHPQRRQIADPEMMHGADPFVFGKPVRSGNAVADRLTLGERNNMLLRVANIPLCRLRGTQLYAAASLHPGFEQ